MSQVNKLWGSAFEVKPEEAMIKFVSGRDVNSVKPADYNLLPYDIWVNQAHCVMLAKQKITDEKSAKIILAGLKQIEKLTSESKFVLDPQKEDVHTNIETWLIEKFGIEFAGKLHTARSRNDQCNVDTRLFLKDQVINFANETLSLVEVLIQGAEKYQDFLVPGFTHHQHAMVTTFGHILLGVAVMMVRDSQRFLSWFKLHNANSLGMSVSFGTSFKIDQNLTSEFLGFDGPDLNSLDEINNRWEAEADLGFAIVAMMNHLSSISQTLILFSTPEFGMIKLSDQFSTGSSIMPQKKNPDPLEVIKGKAGFVAGYLQSLINMGKSNFIGYNRDSQWTKYIIMDMIHECLLAPKILAGVVSTMKVDKKAMEKWCHVGFIGATTVVEQLVQNFEIPFRVAKIAVEKAIKYSNDKNKIEFKAFIKAVKEEKIDVSISEKQFKKWQDPEEIIKITESFGGPGKKAMQKTTLILKNKIELAKKEINEKIIQKDKAKSFLDAEMKKIGGAKNE